MQRIVTNTAGKREPTMNTKPTLYRSKDEKVRLDVQLERETIS